MNTKIKNIIAELIEVDADTITDTALIIDDLGADSIAVMEIVMELEEEFGVEVPTEDVLNLKSVGDIVAYIEAKA